MVTSTSVQLYCAKPLRRKVQGSNPARKIETPPRPIVHPNTWHRLTKRNTAFFLPHSNVVERRRTHQEGWPGPRGAHTARLCSALCGLLSASVHTPVPLTALRYKNFEFNKCGTANHPVTITAPTLSLYQNL
eukprot:2137817-Rhodomonas_salina.1